MRQRRGLELPLRVAGQGYEGALAEAEQAHGALDRAVPLARGDDADRRGAGGALLPPPPPRPPPGAGGGPLAGRPNSSLSQRPATSSITATAGPQAWIAAFWSHAAVSQSAASAAGSVPPMTQPKKRPPLLPRMPPAMSAASSSITCAGSRP